MVPMDTLQHSRMMDRQFRDVTEELGLKLSFYAIGIGVGDADGDGFTDLYIAALGENREEHRWKRFEDVTATAGVAGAPEDYSVRSIPRP